MEAEQANNKIHDEMAKLKEDLRKAEQVKVVAEKQRMQEIERAKEAENEAKLAVEERLKMSEMKDQAKNEVKSALEEMEAKRRIRMVAEQNAAKEMQLAISAAAKSAEEAQKRKEIEKQLKLEVSQCVKTENKRSSETNITEIKLTDRVCVNRASPFCRPNLPPSLRRRRLSRRSGKRRPLS